MSIQGSNRGLRVAPLALILLMSLVSAGPLIAQSDEYQDRLSRVRDVTRNSEVIFVWSEDDGSGVSSATHRIYDLDLAEDNVSERLTNHPIQTEAEIGARRRIAVTSGNFTATSFEHFVSAWTTPDSSVTGFVPEINPEGLDWSTGFSFDVSGKASANLDAKLRLTSGDFAGSDMRDEFALAFEADDSTIRILVYGFEEGSLEPQPLGEIADESVMPGLQSWDLVSGDFDGDSHAELALLFVRPGASADWALSAKIYDVASDGSLNPGAVTEILPKPLFDYSQIDVTGASGDFDSDADLELAVAISFAQNDPEPDTYLYLLDVIAETGAITTSDTTRLARDIQNESEINPINIAAGDLDGDYVDELVMAEGGSWTAYKIEEGSAPEQWKTGGGPQPFEFYDSDRFLRVDDMDANGTDEIILSGSQVDLEPNGVQTLLLWVTGFGADSMFTVLGRREAELPISNNLSRRHFAIALGDFDADRRRLGPPSHYRKTNVIQPSVVLYAPPVHYDILDGTTYDLSGCFPEHSCGFSSTYTQTSANERTVTIERHEDWGVSSGVTLKAELEVSLKSTVGEKFSATSTQKETIRISTGRLAAGDDWIYAHISDIDYYEYPVLEGDDPEPIGYFIVSIPQESSPIWIESKDDALLGNLFRPDHEVGNILSYRLDQPADVDTMIVVFDHQTVGSTGSSSATLELSNFTESGTSTSVDAGYELGLKSGLSVDFYGIEAGIEAEVVGTYSSGDVSTQTVSVEESLEMRGDFGRLQTEFGTAATYQIEPFAYWTRYGALALDYRALIPDAASSFWNTHYGGKTDAGFAMPWRYDSEKGLPLPGGDASYRMRTRDISVSKTDPMEDDTVLVRARVRNMGLADITVPVDVEFYLGAPDAGGVLIGTAQVDSTIASRHSRVVTIEWAIAEGTRFANERIYAVIDPERTLTDEVHENNNVGWAPVVAFGVTTTAEKEVPTEARPTWMVGSPYPNPFDQTTTILVDVPEAAHVRLEVFDVMGRLVSRLSDELTPAGLRAFKFDRSGISNGLYVVRLDARPVASTGRVIRETTKIVVSN